MTCPDCGHENPVGQRFCGQCGRRLDEAEAPAEVRKTVTILFSDVTGSTALGERLDPEAVRGVMTRYFDLARGAIERHGGTVEKFIGDAVMAIFGVPVVHEDDALRATRAAVEMSEALATLNEELERAERVRIAIRTGVNTGEVVVGTGGRTIATGDAVNTAARLEQAAAPGEILLGELTHRLVRDMVLAEEIPPLAAKGKAEPVRAWRLGRVQPDARHTMRRDRPILGRATELELLWAAFERTLAERAPRLVTVVGAPGVGKSRLVEEVLASVDAEVLRGRCLPYGDGITYWPIVEMLTRRAEVTEHDGPEEVRAKLRRLVAGTPDGPAVVDRLAQLLGVAGVAASTEEMHWAVRTLLERLARERPVVVEIDDLQWAEPTLLDLLEHLVRRVAGVPLLLLCSARDELFEGRPDWGEDLEDATTIRLEPLAEDDAEGLVRELLAGVSGAVAERIAASAGRVPLFVEHLVANLVEDGTISWDGNDWVQRDLSTIAVPPSVGAVIGARLERLPREELAILERAAIEGQTFHLGAVVALWPDGEAAGASGCLEQLERRDLIQRVQSRFEDDEGFAFRHLLVRDAAYERVSKRERADLHERFASWLDARAGTGAVEFDEIVGYHLEQSATRALELAPGDERAWETAARAAARLGVAGNRALERGDVAAAEGLLARADSLHRPGSAGRVPALLDLGVVLERQGRYEEAVATLQRAEDLARTAGDPAAAARALTRRQFARTHTELVAQSVLQAEVEPLLPELEASGDLRALAEANFFLGVSSHWMGQELRAMKLLQRAQELGMRSGESRIAAESAGWYLAAVLLAPLPADVVVSRWRAVSDSIPLSRYGRALAESMTSVAIAMTGDIDTAREWCTRARAVVADLGDETGAYASSIMHGDIELLAGDFETAVEVLTDGERGLQRIGEDGYRSSVLMYLADALQALHRPSEAIEVTEHAETITVADDLATLAGLRAARARALADLGRFDETDQLCREALDLLGRTELVDETACGWSSVGYVQATAGRTREAVLAYREALERFEVKGSVLSIARVRRTIAVIQGEDPGPTTVPAGAWGTTWPMEAAAARPRVGEG